MSKWVEIPVTIFKTYAVEIEDSETIEDAIQYALEECMESNTEVDRKDCLIAKNDMEAEQIKRCSDEKISL